MSSNRRVYEELREEIEGRGGTMSFRREDSRWGAWEVCLLGRSARFESNGAGFPDLDRLYVPKIEDPRHWSDYSNALVPAAIDKLLSRLV